MSKSAGLSEGLTTDEDRNLRAGLGNHAWALRVRLQRPNMHRKHRPTPHSHEAPLQHSLKLLHL